MTQRVVTRGSTVTFSFTFYDANDELATVTSATLQLTYPGLDDFVTETLTLTEGEDDAWAVEWDSSKSRPGWCEYHAHAMAQGIEDEAALTEDGRIRLTGNRAGLDHDALPTATTASTSAQGYTSGTDYGA